LNRFTFLLLRHRSRLHKLEFRWAK